MAGNIQCQLVIFHSFGAFVGININLILTQNLSDSLLCSCFYYFIIDLALGEIEILFLKKKAFCVFFLRRSLSELIQVLFFNSLRNLYILERFISFRFPFVGGWGSSH